MNQTPEEKAKQEAADRIKQRLDMVLKGKRLEDHPELIKDLELVLGPGSRPSGASATEIPSVQFPGLRGPL